MLLGPEPDQDFLIARSDDQTGWRRDYGKRIGGIDSPRVVYHNQGRPVKEERTPNVLTYVDCS